MEEAARRFARWVLAIHIVLLTVVVALVFVALREVYRGARAEAIVEASKRQTLLAEQTARGIEAYYNSIIENLELLRRTEEDETTSGTSATPSTAPTTQQQAQ